MALYVPDVAEEDFLDLLLAVNYTLRLYKTTDVTSGLTDSQISALTSASFTEATFTGYAAKALTGGSWTSTQGDPSTGTYAQQTFTSTANQAAQTIYGYYVTRTSDNKLRWHERFTGPVVISSNGDTIQITPTLTLDDDREATVAARGLVALQTLTSNGGPYSTNTTTDMVLNNVDVDATRNYRIGVNATANLTAAAGFWDCNVSVDGTNTFRLGAMSNDGFQTFNNQFCGQCIWQPATGTFDLAVVVLEGSGSADLTLAATSTQPRQFWVEDIGPR